MSTKKKRHAPKPRPRTTYDVTLDHAQARLVKAQKERTDCLMKLDALARQIPWLENIVTALTTKMEASPTPTALAAAPTPPSAPPVGAPSPMDQQEFLAKFMPRPSRTTTTVPPAGAAPAGNSEDPDEFLSDGGPGHEILS